MAALAPMPSASVTMTVTASPFTRARDLTAKRRSERRFRFGVLICSYRMESARIDRIPSLPLVWTGRPINYHSPLPTGRGFEARVRVLHFGDDRLRVDAAAATGTSSVTKRPATVRIGTTGT